MMNKKLALAVLMVTAPMGAMAGADGDCGLGTMVFDGQRGIAPQILAITTNGTFFQTFAVTSGTSGCNPNAVVKSNWKTAMFIDGNKGALARDMSTGSGEALDTLAALIGVQEADKAAFARVTRDNFAQIFSAERVSALDVLASLKQVLAANGDLARYATTI